MGGMAWFEAPLGSDPSPGASVRTSATFPADSESPWRARELVTSTLAESSCSAETVDVARLLVSELVTNAVVHAATDMTVEIVLTEYHVRISVHDGMEALVGPPQAGAESTSGRGLLLLDAVADTWGCDVSDKPDRAKVVWFVVSWD